jgi:DNA-binding MarR family transcriptional regulator
MLAAYPGQSGADIARLALLTPQTVSVIQNLDLTESGRALLAAARERMRELERELTAGITSEEEQVVRRWLVGTAVADVDTGR